MTGKYFEGIGNKNIEVDFYVIKGIAEEILDYLGYGTRYSFIKQEFPKEFHQGQTAYISVNNEIVGIIGKLHPTITKENIYVLEINLTDLLNKKTGKMKYKEISKFPNVKKDLAIVIDKKITSKEVEEVIKKAGGSLLTKLELFDLYTGQNIDENKKSLAYSLTFENKAKTLTDEEINKVLENIIEMLDKKLGGTLRK